MLLIIRCGADHASDFVISDDDIIDAVNAGWRTGMIWNQDAIPDFRLHWNERTGFRNKSGADRHNLAVLCFLFYVLRNEYSARRAITFDDSPKRHVIVQNAHHHAENHCQL